MRKRKFRLRFIRSQMVDAAVVADVVVVYSARIERSTRYIGVRLQRDQSFFFFLWFLSVWRTRDCSRFFSLARGRVLSRPGEKKEITVSIRWYMASTFLVVGIDRSRVYVRT